MIVGSFEDVFNVIASLRSHAQFVLHSGLVHCRCLVSGILPMDACENDPLRRLLPLNMES
jgi:hypothetical protein